ncbi:MBL fold metallo-hydrolase [Thiosulfativibrio zosterae]|uniref:Metallo-beta-lactamase domain-containing protein n=1 Tax=Thiosulfativibrio zosterae TaxID=2675053 RepID=A0A6F8PMB4_9GAMM|nr:MBL fold metallo-hydrolase [Thiosulfativibrio zosterae]BBP43251.1 hypothetical protein THMIRHAT_09970 [Thiosulfativibrio zosterae]
MSSFYELTVLGSGAGASSVYEGLTSSSFMLSCDGQPFCLVDLGLGVGREVMRQFGEFPSKVIITHNHSDHAGDLPVVALVELKRGNRLQIIAQTEVMQRLKQHRMAEHHQQAKPEALADWVGLPEGESFELGFGLTLAFYRGEHSELSFGFRLMDAQGQIRLAYTADSCVSTALYEKLAPAQVFILDARPKPNAWHADFAQIQPWLKPGVFILGHGLSKAKAYESYPELPLLLAGQTLVF